MSSTIEERIKRIVSEQTGVDESKITPATHLVEDLGCDSLDLVELVMNVEDEFAVEIPDEDAEAIKTVGQAIEYLSARVQPQLI